MSMKNSNDTSWDRTSDLLICSTTHSEYIYIYIYINITILIYSCVQTEYITLYKNMFCLFTVLVIKVVIEEVYSAVLW